MVVSSPPLSIQPWRSRSTIPTYIFLASLWASFSVPKRARLPSNRYCCHGDSCVGSCCNQHQLEAHVPIPIVRQANEEGSEDTHPERERERDRERLVISVKHTLIRYPLH
ncbi:hypothetical protein AMECASPLE_004191 [Ameca splendens]|uniref:Secreted protein n=1 Tax=Ameca splendens TaxID=208324 RepID=A0ABV0Z7W7_9TELE